MYQITVEGDKATLVLSGEVDLQTTADLKNEISELSGISTLDIIASSVTYIDSSGVAVLLMTRQHCLASNIELSLSAVSEPVFRVLEIAKLDKLLPIGQVVEIDTTAVDNFGVSLVTNTADDAADPAGENDIPLDSGDIKPGSFN
ncbi:MAG: STAS domain-containing protein [Candidatus Puniceispirillales bacterium]